MAFNLVPEYPEGTIGNGCFCCRVQRRPEERLVDLNVTIDFEGFAILCETCAKEIAHVFGWITDDISRIREAETAELTQLRRDNVQMRKALNAVDGARALV